MSNVDSGFMMDMGETDCCWPCTPEEERQAIIELTMKAESNLREGESYYLISNSNILIVVNYGAGLLIGRNMWDKVVMKTQLTINLRYLKIFASQLQPLDPVLSIIDIILNEFASEGDDLQLSITLVESLDYVLVPREVWEKLFDWYTGGPALPRKLISLGDGGKMFSVEVYPVSLKLTDSRDCSQSTIRLSRKASIRELYERVCSVTGIEQEKARLWDYYNKMKQSILDVFNQTLEESKLQMNQDILLEVEVDGFWLSRFAVDSAGNELALVPVVPSSSSVTIAGGETSSNSYSAGHGSNFYQGTALGSISTDLENGIISFVSKEERGLAGLENLGNTCFMNSAIQCLAHTPPLVNYFKNDYSADINKVNPLGMNGELALAFGELLKTLWVSGRTSIAPRNLKGKLSLFAPQFSDCSQHDSQELLAFLLDGLHEDLNLVKQKPYIMAKDSDGRTNDEVAEECWKNHMAQNDSLIVDVCQGQYKSTLVCPDCGKVSVTFDPFMYLSLPLPLPSIASRKMTVTVFYGDGNGLPKPFTVTVLKQGSCKDLLQAISVECGLKSEEVLLLAEVYQNQIYKYFVNLSEPLSSINNTEHIVAYRQPKKYAGMTELQITHRCCEKYSLNTYGDIRLLGSPLVTYLDVDPTSGADIYDAVSKVLSPMRRESFFSSTKALSSVDNGSSEALDESENSCYMDSESGNQTMEDEDMSDEELTFQLYLTDDRLNDLKPIEKDSTIKPGDPPIYVMMDWTEKEHGLYDANYLKYLPEVCKVRNTESESISLFSCLDAFLKEEPLSCDDTWFCPGCQEHRQASKKLDLWRLPDILVFHLKRFSYSRFLRNKMDTFVDFPVHNLDLSNHVKSNDSCPRSSVYELYAISNHYGGLCGGHYTAYAKLIDEDKWYHFDDCLVSEISEADIKTPAAYVLFYQRVTDQPKNGVRESSESDISSGVRESSESDITSGVTESSGSDYSF